MKKDIGNTKAQLTDEVRSLLQKIGELEARVTVGKQAEEELWKSEEKYRTLVEGLEDVIVRFALDGTILYCSPNVNNFGGYDSKEEIGQHFTKYIADEEARQELQEFFQGIIKRKKTITFEFRYMPKSKDPFYVEAKANPIINEKTDEIVSIQCIVRDITERKKAEEELKEYSENLEGMVEERTRELKQSEAELATIFDNAPIVMILVDQERRVRKANYNAVRFGRRAVEEMIGLHGGEALRCIHSSDDPRGCGFGLHCKGCPVRRMVVRTFKTRKNHYRVEAKLQFASRRGDVVVLVSTVLLNLEEGERVLVSIEDITERKEAEERERQLQAELIHSRRLAAIGELAAGIAHEINNPLTGILGFSERLLRKSTDEEARRDLARVTNEAQRVSKIVENLLTFARRREPKKEQIDVNEILQRTLELRAYELKTSNIEVEVECASGLRKVMADFQRIQEVFLNLILNAEQAMSEANKGGKLGIKTERVKGGIRVSFADDGPGIKAENLDSLFDPFFTTRGESGGTGLGLSVCHGIVTEHGGRIYADRFRAESEEGKGATFFVELPVAAKK